MISKPKANQGIRQVKVNRADEIYNYKYIMFSVEREEGWI